MKKESVFDLVTGVYLIGCGVALLDAIKFDMNKFWLLWKVGFNPSNLGVLEDVMKALVRVENPISGELLLPAVAELVLTAIFLFSIYIVFCISKRELLFGVFRKRKAELRRRISVPVSALDVGVDAYRSPEEANALVIFLYLSGLVFLYLWFFSSLFSKIPPELGASINSFYFIIFMLASSIKIIFSFWSVMDVRAGKDSKKMIGEYYDLNKGYIFRSFAVLAIVVFSVWSLSGTRWAYAPQGHGVGYSMDLPAAVIGYYLLGGVFFLGLFFYELLKTMRPLTGSKLQRPN